MDNLRIYNNVKPVNEEDKKLNTSSNCVGISYSFLINNAEKDISTKIGIEVLAFLIGSSLEELRETMKKFHGEIDEEKMMIFFKNVFDAQDAEEWINERRTMAKLSGEDKNCKS